MKIEFLQDDFATARRNKTKTQHCTALLPFDIEIRIGTLER